MPKLHRRTVPVLLAVAALALVTGLVVTGTSGDGQDAARPRASATRSPVQVVVPGRPGESARVVDSDDIKAPDGSVHNQLDVEFVRMMIPHHTQGLQIAALAAGRAADPQIVGIAERIRASQLPEVTMMRNWLAARKLPVEDPRVAHDHTNMPGMQTPEAIDALAGLSGAEFDKRFVALMTAHHEGAIQMAQNVLKVGRSQEIDELANGIMSDQTIEIRRMREVVGG